jgi:hypothetical protein
MGSGVSRVFYPDLSTQCQVDQGDHIRTVGWLSKDHPFPTGTVASEFLAALWAHLCAAWQPVYSMGVHFCDFCPTPMPDAGRVGGSRNLWIPAESAVYVAPELVAHYVKDHGYLPPDEFINAVLACPKQDSPSFHQMLARFPRWWKAVEQVAASETGRSP